MCYHLVGEHVNNTLCRYVPYLVGGKFSYVALKLLMTLGMANHFKDVG